MRESALRRHVIGLIVVVVLVPVVLELLLGGWKFYQERAAAARQLSGISELPQVDMLPPHAERVSDERHAGEHCLIGVCTDTAVSIKQTFFFSGTKEAITKYYDRIFISNGWNWSKYRDNATYDRRLSGDECVTAALEFEQETVYRLTYVPCPSGSSATIDR